MIIKELAKYIDHTCLKPEATCEDVEQLCREAAEYGFASVCVNPSFVLEAGRLLDGTGVKICTVIGFPLGANTTEIKALETRQAFYDGADEFDMVIAVGALKEKRFDYVKRDIEAVVKEARGKTVKVIIETAYLTDDEKVAACRISAEAGADFVKTCTGFSNVKSAPNRATVHDVELMKKSIPAGMKVKASGGIRTYADALALINAGADRLGASAGVRIITEAKEKI